MNKERLKNKLDIGYYDNILTLLTTKGKRHEYKLRRRQS